VKRFNLKVGLAAALVLLAASNAAMATGLDYSTLTSAINLDDVGPAILAGAGSLVALYVVILGIKKIIAFVRAG